jgi:hypothetical protein
MLVHDSIQFSKNHEWTRINTNFFEKTTDYTEQTESLAAGPTISCGICLYIMNSEC